MIVRISLAWIILFSIVNQVIAQDVWLQNYSAPTTQCSLSNAETVNVLINNNSPGIMASNTINVSYSVNGGTPVSQLLNSNLFPGASWNFTFTVKANLSACGTYALKVWVTRTGDTNPLNDVLEWNVTNNCFNAPGSISGPVTVCQGQDSVTYTFPAMLNATAYSWTLPNGASGSSVTNSIMVDYSTTATPGNITVAGTNTCGSSTAAVLPVTVNLLPDAAGTISGSSTICQGENGVTYTVPPIARALSYQWTLPNGATGSSTTNQIVLNYSTNAVSGPLTVKGINACGSGVVSSASITVNTDAPVANCQNITVQLDATGHASITAAQINNGSTDACGIASLALDVTDFDCNDIGSNTVLLTVTDNNGNASTCNATVTVEDTIAPIANCQNITVLLDATGNINITPAQVNNGSTDACGIASLALDVTDFDCSNIGANTVTLTVTDNNGNFSTCTSIVTVLDTVAPVINCKNLTVQLDASGNATITAAQINNGSLDACSNISAVLDITDFDCSDVGTNAVNLTVSDNNGNSSNCTATVTVQDTIAPVVNCQNITVQLDATGNATITAAQINNGSADACGIASLALDVTDFDCNDIGSNTVLLTVTDNNGNTSTCNATVTVEDTIAPIANCQNIAVQLDATGNINITPAQVNNGSTDACGIASLALDVTDFDCSNIGANTVTLTVTDNNGNFSTCTSIVTVLDTVAPVINCKNLTVQLDASGNATITAAQINNGSLDACSNISAALDITDFDCSHIGTNAVTLTVSDNNGNSSNCTATVTVQDTIAPVVNCQNITVQLNATGTATITAAQINNGSTDACGIASLVLDVTDFDCSNIGLNTVLLTVTDNNGNASTCNATVTVEDSIAPVVNCQNISVLLDATGNINITPAQVNNGSTDACSIASLAIDITDFDCSNIGTNTVTLTVTDNNGNASTCSATVLVQDTITPVATCRNITAYLDATGNAFVTATQIDNGSADACGIASLAIDVTNFDCSKIGANTVVLTVTDNNSNTSTCSATVTIIDTIAPVAVCQPITVQLDATGNATVTAAQINNGSTDACGIAFSSISPDHFNCASNTTNNVLFTVTDVNGNSATCTAVVTVLGNSGAVVNTTINEVICGGDSYIFGGQAITANGTYYDTLSTVNGCDSVLILNLTVYPLALNTITASICDGEQYTFRGRRFTAPGIYSDTITNANGCDSIITLNLTVLPLLTASISGALCPNSVFKFYDDALVAPGIYTHLASASAGCDTLVTLTLTAAAVNTNATVAGAVCTAAQNGATYQWYTCNTGQPIPGATAQSYTAPQNGSYQCLVTYDSCSVPTICVFVRTVGIETLNTYDFKLYPNPNNGSFVFEHDYEGEIQLQVLDMFGRMVKQFNSPYKKEYLNLNDIEAAVYEVVVSSAASGEKLTIIKMVKQ